MDRDDAGRVQADAALEAVSRVLSILNRSSFDLDRVLQTVVESAVRVCDADQGNVARQEGDAYRIVAYTGIATEYIDVVRDRVYRPERGSVIGRTLLERRPVHIADVLEDPDYELHEAQRRGGYRTLLGVPMMKDGFPIGVIAVGRPSVRPFSQSEIRLLTTFADQCALAIENARLYQTVERQRRELAGFAPHVASLLSTREGEELLKGHRREVTALFCDLRGFTAFGEAAEPEDVLGVLREYYSTVGRLVLRHGGIVEHFAGDGLMIIFNDPTPVPDHTFEAVLAAVEMRKSFRASAAAWQKLGYQLGLGIGIASGYATLGRIGFEGRYDYGAIGNAVTLASRLSDAATAGQILMSQRAYAAVEGRVTVDPIGELAVKGFTRPVPVHAVRDAGEGESHHEHAHAASASQA